MLKLVGEGALSAISVDEGVVPASEVKELRKEIRELERLLGRKTMEVEILKDAVHIDREKTDLTSSVVVGGRFPVKTVTDTMEVCRSRQHERKKRGGFPRKRYYEKPIENDVPQGVWKNQ